MVTNDYLNTGAYSAWNEIFRFEQNFSLWTKFFAVNKIFTRFFEDVTLIKEMHHVLSIPLRSGLQNSENFHQASFISHQILDHSKLFDHIIGLIWMSYKMDL